MDPSFSAPLLTLLSATVAFNLLLSLRLATIVGLREKERLPTVLPPGSTFPRFKAKTLAGQRVDNTSIDSRPAVFVYLSPSCKDCASKLPIVEALFPAAERLGVELWVIGVGSRTRLELFFADSSIWSRVLVLRGGTRRRVCPRNAAPAYAFVNQDGRVEAANFIGDARWRAFLDQLGHVDGVVEAAE